MKQGVFLGAPHGIASVGGKAASCKWRRMNASLPFCISSHVVYDLTKKQHCTCVMSLLQRGVSIKRRHLSRTYSDDTFGFIWISFERLALPYRLQQRWLLLISPHGDHVCEN